MTRPGQEVVVAVLTTAPDEQAAQALAERAVDGRLAACVSLIPGMKSVYRWEGEVKIDDEVQLVFKTTMGRAGDLRAVLEEWHPYDVPELLVLPIVEGSEQYMDWVRSEVGG